MTYIQSILIASLLWLTAIHAAAQPVTPTPSSFKVVDNPGGGQYIYGPIPGQGSLPDAIIYTLRNIHAYFGNKPEPGKFFQTRDGSEVAAFFSVNAKKLGDQPMTGLMIVTHAGNDTASIAVLFDVKARFGSSEPAMLKAPAAAWRPAAAGATDANGLAPQPVATPARRGQPMPLTQTSGGDCSAVISLPAGWKSTFVGGGAVTAEGANGEKVYLGILYQGYVMGPICGRTSSISTSRSAVARGYRKPPIR